MEKYQISNIEELNGELILQLINRYKISELPRLKKLYNYYIGKQEILNRTMSSSDKPNHQTVNNFCSLIVENINGYFLGNPVSYKSSIEDQLEKMQYIYDSNEEQFLNARIGREVSIYGVSYEIHYTDGNANPRFSYLSPLETFMIFDNSIESKPLAAVRFYEKLNYITDETEMKIEVYDENFITSYKLDGDTLLLTDEPKQHYYNAVPVIQYLSNNEAIGDFERIIDLQDAYNLVTADQLNSISYFSDSYLVLSDGATLEAEDLLAMQDSKIIMMGEKGKAEFLNKGDISGIRDFSKRIKEDIHTISFTPDIASDTFGSPASGEAIRYRLFSLETLVSQRERFFKKGLEKRVELVTQYLNTMGGSYEPTEITMSFSRNMPSNNETIAGIVQKLSGILSQQTLISLLPFVEDAGAEMLLKKQENEGTLYDESFDSLTAK